MKHILRFNVFPLDQCLEGWCPFGPVSQCHLCMEGGSRKECQDFFGCVVCGCVCFQLLCCESQMQSLERAHSVGESLGASSFSRHCLGLTRSQPRCLHEEWARYTEASSGCWRNLSPGCRIDIPVFLLVVPVGSSFTFFFIGFLSFLPLVCLQHGSLLLPSLQQDLFF